MVQRDLSPEEAAAGMRDTGLLDRGGDQEKGPPGGVAGIRDLLIEDERGGAEIAREIMEFPTEPAEYLGRTVYTEKEIKRNGRLLSKLSALKSGTSNITGVMWYHDGAKISLNREGRKEMVAVMNGVHQRRRGEDLPLGERFEGKKRVEG